MVHLRLLVVMGILSICGLLMAEQPGDIRGRVKFEGDIPVPEQLRVGGDRVCEDLTKNKPLFNQEVIVSPQKTLKNVVVWVDSGWLDNGKPQINFKEKASVVQQGCEFYPHVLAVQTGQEILVENKDSTLHNMNTSPKNNPRQNYVMFADNLKPVTLKFDKPELGILLKDDIHPWMTSWVAVFDHPAFAITDDDGRFEIKNLHPGEYVLKAWHEKFGVVSAPVLVKKEEPTEVTFEFTATGAKAGAKAERGDGTVTTSTLKWE